MIVFDFIIRLSILRTISSCVGLSAIFSISLYATILSLIKQFQYLLRDIETFVTQTYKRLKKTSGFYSAKQNIIKSQNKISLFEYQRFLMLYLYIEIFNFYTCIRLFCSTHKFYEKSKHLQATPFFSRVVDAVQQSST